MSMESQALKEIKSLQKDILTLQATVSKLLCIPHVCGGFGCKHCETLTLTPSVHLNQHNIALLKQLRQEWANGPDVDFYDFYNAYIVNLELDK